MTTNNVFQTHTETFAQRLKVLRRASYLSQEELAKRVMCAPQTIASYERAEKLPPVIVLIRLALEFECSTDFLLGLSDVREWAA